MMRKATIFFCILCYNILFDQVYANRFFQSRKNTAKTVSRKDNQIPNEFHSFGEHFSEESNLLTSTSTSYPPPNPCINNISQLAYMGGELSASQTFYNCLANIGDPAMIATFYNATYNGILTINSSLTLNNLASIDEVTQSATLQFSLRLYWKDDRFAMPEFWDKTPLSTQSFGIDLTTIMINSSILLWTPDIRFPDAVEINYYATYLRLNASNIFTWGTGISVTLQESEFVFANYPEDTQKIVVRYSIFNYDATRLMIGFNGGNALLFNQNVDGGDTFKSNPIWTYKSYSYETYVSNSNIAYAVYNINVTRQGKGIIFRLVLPITFLLLLAGLTFWVLYENRVDTTITLLLSVSALYIVILQNIPLVGYLTLVDTFVFTMFILLVVVVCLHQVYATLYAKQDRWPLRIVYLRLIEFTGRTVIIPFIIIYFFREMFKGDSADSGFSFAMIFLASIYLFVVGFRESVGVKASLEVALARLQEKFNNNETTVKDISAVEVALINFIKFRKFSTKRTYITEYLKTKGKLDISSVGTAAVRLKNLNTFLEITKGSTSDISSADTKNPLTRRYNSETGIHMRTFTQKFDNPDSSNIKDIDNMEMRRSTSSVNIDVDSDDEH